MKFSCNFSYHSKENRMRDTWELLEEEATRGNQVTQGRRH